MFKLNPEQIEKIALRSEEDQVASMCRHVFQRVSAHIDFYPEALCNLTVRIFWLNLADNGVTDTDQKAEITRRYFELGKPMTHPAFAERWRQIMLGRSFSSYLKGKELLALLDSAEKS